MSSYKRTQQANEVMSTDLTVDEYLTPEQRLRIVADILSDIALRIVKENHENQS